MLRPLPDPDISLRDAADFILDAPIGRKALEWNELPGFPTMLRDLLGHIYRLTQSCHLSEFTDHGLPHICSLVERVSSWTCPPQSGISRQLVEELNPREAALLFVAILIHDIGMLSQRSEDLPLTDSRRNKKLSGDIAQWVRQTHIPRLEGLVRRLFSQTSYASMWDHEVLSRVFAIARAHGAWPWEQDFVSLTQRESGLAAVLAVADLLDEDSMRCDTATLLSHRYGTIHNMAHWMRHTLTSNRVNVHEGCIRVILVRPPNVDGTFAPFFSALRNHYRLALLYQVPLSFLSSTILQLNFSPQTGVPSDEALVLSNWHRIAELPTPGALLFHLLQTFMPIALGDVDKLSPEVLGHMATLGMEPVDLRWLRQCTGRIEPRSPYEASFRAMIDSRGNP